MSPGHLLSPHHQGVTGSSEPSDQKNTNMMAVWTNPPPSLQPPHFPVLRLGSWASCMHLWEQRP